MIWLMLYFLLGLITVSIIVYKEGKFTLEDLFVTPLCVIVWPILLRFWLEDTNKIHKILWQRKDK